MKFSVHNLKLLFKSARHFKHNSIFYKIFIIIGATIIIIGFLNYAILNYSKSILLDKEEKVQEICIDYYSSYIDNLLVKIRDAVSLIEYENDISTLLRITSKGDDAYGDIVKSTIKKLVNIKINIPEIKNIYIYQFKIDTILDSYGTTDLDVYFYSKYSGNFEEWKKFINSKHQFSLNLFTNQKYINDNTENPNIICIAFTLRNSTVPSGTIMVELDSRKVYESLYNNSFLNDRKLYIVNAEGQILSSNTSDKLTDFFSLDWTIQNNYFEKGKYFVKLKESMLKNLKYIIITPCDLIYGNITSVSNIMNIFLLILLIAGISVSLYIAQRLYYPISKTVECISIYSNIYSNVYDELDFINNNIKEIVSNEKYLKNTIQNSIRMINDLIIFYIICGDQIGIDNAKKIINDYNIDIKDGYYFTCVIKVDTNFEASKLFSVINNRLSPYIISILKLNKFEYCMIIFYNEINIETNIICELEQFVNNLENKEKTNIYIGIGNKYKSILELNQSYVEALIAINKHHVGESSRVFRYSEEDGRTEKIISLPFNYEQRLAKYIYNGNIDMVSEYMMDLFNEASKGNTSYTLYCNMCKILLAFADRIVNDVKLSYDKIFSYDKRQELDNIEYINDINHINNTILLLFLNITSYFRKTYEENSLIKRILDYINNNVNKDIYIGLISSEFGLTSNYFSRYFKQCVGMTFVDYLNITRIEIAKELLSKTTNQINLISESVGFNSSNVFIRTFEKYEGVTPGEYRKRLLGV